MNQIEVEPPAGTAPTERSRQANMVLLGCSLLQLPVWGFAISYGVLQEYYTSSANLGGDVGTTGIIGTTLNGIIYLSMPFLFGLFTYRYAHLRRKASFLGIALSVLSLVLSSFGTQVWHLIVTQAILQGIGSTLLYSASTIYLDEWFVQRKGIAYGITLSAKSAVGVGIPLLFEKMLSHLGFRNTLRIWAAITFATSVPAIFLLTPRFPHSGDTRRERTLSWTFLHHPTFWIFSFSNMVFAASYGVPQTYLSTFASEVLQVNASTSALMLTVLNIPSFFASYFFGFLCDGAKIWRGRSLSMATICTLSSLGSCLPVFFLWGMVPGPSPGGIALLALFAVIYGFFAGGYSTTWGGILKEMQREAIAKNEALDTALIFGLLNGGRGIGFVAGGLLSVPLLQIGAVDSGRWAYGSKFGSLILFTGIGAAFGGSSILSKLRK